MSPSPPSSPSQPPEPQPPEPRSSEPRSSEPRPSEAQASAPAPFPSFVDGPPAPERGRAIALAVVVLLLGLAALLVGLGPYLTAHTSAGTITVSGFALPQGMTVVAALLFAGLVAGLSTLPRLAAVHGATPVLHAIATAAATVGTLLALFVLIVLGNVATPADLVGGNTAVSAEPMVIGLGWGGITILVLAGLQAIVAFVALAYDVGLAQARRTPEPPHEPFLPPEPEPEPAADDAPTTVIPATAATAPKAEPTKTQPTKTEPTKTEPTKTEPTKTEPTKTRPAKTEPAVQAEPTKAESE